MGDKDKKIEQLKQDLARWKGRALEAANKACRECDQMPVYCEKCRIRKIKEEAGE